jgi:hypothetical protein
MQKLWLEVADVADVSLTLHLSLSNTAVELKREIPPPLKVTSPWSC